MKKMLAMMMAMLLMIAPAMAEGTANPEVSYQGVWREIEGPAEMGFSVFLPASWRDTDWTAPIETDEDRQQIAYADNLYCAITGGNGVWGLTIGWTERTDVPDAETLLAEVAEAYADAEIVTIGEVEFVRYTDAERDAVVLLIAEATGVHDIALLPASDVDFTPWMEEIIPTICVTLPTEAEA